MTIGFKVNMFLTGSTLFVTGAAGSPGGNMIVAVPLTASLLSNESTVLGTTIHAALNTISASFTTLSTSVGSRGAGVEITDSTNSQGSSSNLASADHRHAHGARSGGSLHFTASVLGGAGFTPGTSGSAQGRILALDSNLAPGWVTPTFGANSVVIHSGGVSSVALVPGGNAAAWDAAIICYFSNSTGITVGGLAPPATVGSPHIKFFACYGGLVQWAPENASAQASWRIHIADNVNLTPSAQLGIVTIGIYDTFFQRWLMLGAPGSS